MSIGVQQDQTQSSYWLPSKVIHMRLLLFDSRRRLGIDLRLNEVL